MILNQAILIELQYLPNIQYFTKFLKYDKVILEQSENYVKGSFRNRCQILSANGPISISIPLQKGKNQQQSIKSVKIFNEDKWQNQHWTAIKSAYGSAPYFDYYEASLQQLIKQPFENLWDFNFNLLEWLIKQLKLDTVVEVTSEFEQRPNSGIKDWRNNITPKKHKQKIDPSFEPTYYAQVFEDKFGFVANLSILDLLFCTGPQASLILESSIKADNR